MRGRLAIAAVLTAAVLPLSAGPADAQARLRFGYFPYEPSYDSYYPGPMYIPAPRYRYYQRIRPRRWDPAWRRPAARNLYNYDPNDPYYTETPQYYEPDIAPPPRRLKKKKLAIPTKKTIQKDVATQDDGEAAPAPAKKKTGAISCDKAGEIVTGYGFSGVKATSCQGNTYSFAAARDGKPYAIKLSAASGELTEVKKVK
jgi:hypothetical protein